MIDLALVEKVNTLKERFPCSTERIDSTALHNASPAVGGAKGSYHIDVGKRLACACDLSFDSASSLIPAALYAKVLGFGGIEVDFRNNHLHVDLRANPWHVVCIGTIMYTLDEYLTERPPLV
jgi:hypothetical protein